jgi:hypothetical protein
MQNKSKKRILSVTIKRMADDSPDTSWLGEYSNTCTSEYSIDRKHSEDCASVRPDIQTAKKTLEHVQQTIGDLHNAVLAQYNGTLANARLDAEKDALDTAYETVGELFDSIDECDCGEHGDMRRGTYRYFNPSFNYVDKNGHALKENTAEEVRKYVRQDYERMESLNSGQWCFLSINAEAKVSIPCGESSVESTVGLNWCSGYDSDMGQTHLDEIEADHLSELRKELKALGFSTRAISTAFKNVQREEN